MRLNMIGCGIALGAAALLAGCAPGPGGYAAFSNYRQQQADQHAYLARRNEQAARWQSATGDYYGAQRSEEAAGAQAAAARQEQAHANRDRLLSGF